MRISRDWILKFKIFYSWNQPILIAKWKFAISCWKKNLISINVYCTAIRDLHVKSLSLMIYELRVKNLKLKKYMGIKKFSDRRIRLKMLLQTVILNVLVCIIWMSMNVQSKLHKFSILVTQYKRVHMFTFTKDLDKPTHDLRLYHYKFWEFLRTECWKS